MAERNTMGIFDGLLLASDFDGTLMIKGKLNTDDIAAAREFVDGGGLFTLNTGRTVQSMSQYVDCFPRSAPYILCNGSCIYDYARERTLWRIVLEEDVARTVAREIMSVFPDVGVEACTVEDIFLLQDSDYARYHIEREKLRAISFTPEDAPGDWIKIVMLGDNARLKAVEAYLESEGMRGMRSMFTEAIFFELISLSASKGEGLAALAAQFAIPRERVFALGDYYNDIDALRWAGVGAAIEGAPDGLLRAADFTVPAEGGALRHMVEHIRALREGGNV